MKTINKKPFGILASLALISACISGCGEAQTVWDPLSDNTVKIAVLSDPVMDENFINTCNVQRGHKFTKNLQLQK